MGYTDRETHRVALKNPDYYVDIYTELLYGDEEKIDSIGTLPVIISSWNVNDKDGNLLPVNPENVKLLKQDDAIRIIKEAQKIFEKNKSKESTKKKDSPNS